MRCSRSAKVQTQVSHVFLTENKLGEIGYLPGKFDRFQDSFGRSRKGKKKRVSLPAKPRELAGLYSKSSETF